MKKFYNVKELKEQVKNIEELESYFICYTIITKNNEQISILSNQYQDNIKLYNHMTKEVGYNVMNDDILTIVNMYDILIVDYISSYFLEEWRNLDEKIISDILNENELSENIEILLADLNFKIKGGF